MKTPDQKNPTRPAPGLPVGDISANSVEQPADAHWRSTTQRAEAGVYAEECSAHIAILMNESPSVQWAIIAGKGLVLSRAMSQDEAAEVRAWLASHLRADEVDLQLVPIQVHADYLGVTGPCSAQARFCEWASKKLGHVTVFAFEGLDDPGFMVVADDGHRASGKTLAAALYALLEQNFYAAHKPLYTDKWLDDSDAYA